MKTHQLTHTLEGLITRNRVDLALAVLVKVLKHIDKNLYRQAVQLSAQQHACIEQRGIGAISSEMEQQQRNRITQAALELLERIEQGLPPQFSGEHADTVGQILGAIEGLDWEEKNTQVILAELYDTAYIPARRKGPSRWGASIRGLLFALSFSFMALCGGAIGSELSKVKLREPSARQEVRNLAAAYGLLDIAPPNQHLSYSDAEIDFWYYRLNNGLPKSALMQALSAQARIVEEANREGREILSREDLLTLSFQRP